MKKKHTGSEMTHLRLFAYKINGGSFLTQPSSNEGKVKNKYKNNSKEKKLN